MKIAVTSDTHGRHFNTPPADVFIHCGDITNGGTLEDTASFAKKLAKTDYKHIVLVPGNHDQCFQKRLRETTDLFDDRVTILIDQSLVIDGVTFWGSPWTPPFFDWYFMAEEEELSSIYGVMPCELDVLVTHGPPRGILDPGFQDPHVGSTAMLSAVLSRDVKHHVFGHLHGAGGQSVMRQGTSFHNVAACNEAYKLVNEPLIIEL